MLQSRCSKLVHIARFSRIPSRSTTINSYLQCNLPSSSCLHLSSINRGSPSIYYFSTESKDKKEEVSQPNENDPKDKSLFDTINRMKSEADKDEKEETKTEPKAENDIIYNLKQHLLKFQDQVMETWEELLDSGKAKGIQERIHQSEALRKQRESYKGPTELIIIDEKEHLGAWDKMQRRLSSAPIIQDMLGKSYELFEKAGGKEVQKKLKDVKEDAQEVWETSQNPWVYRVSSVYETITAESEFAAATRLLRRTDPGFAMETFLHDCVEYTLPQVMKWILTNDMDSLHPFLGESVYHRLDAEMTARKKEKLVLDSNLLGIFNADIITAQIDAKNEEGEKEPILLIHYMAQQINCVRDEEGKVVQGKEDEIKANSYLVAFQREHGDGGMVWKIVDFRFNGAVAWI